MAKSFNIKNYSNLRIILVSVLFCYTGLIAYRTE